MPSPYGALAEQLGDPRAANPTLDALRAQLLMAPGPNGPMPSAEDIQRHLAMTGQQYPALFPVNQQAWNAMVERWPQSRNIEDRRGIPPPMLARMLGYGGSL